MIELTDSISVKKMKKIAAPIGILGEGQLALMLGESAHAQDVDFLGFGEDRDSSFARKFPNHFVQGRANDATALIEFAKQCSVLTLENEFLSADLLEEIEKRSGTPIVPRSSDYRHFENKFAQRSFYDSLKIDSPEWALYHESQKLSYPVVLKASQGGYDGYGVRVVSQAAELDAALNDLKFQDGAKVIVEEKIAIRIELAQGALFDGAGSMVLLPLVETVQKNGICEIVLSKPRLDGKSLKNVSLKIESELKKIADSNITGLFNFEFFFTHDERVLINEGAPRPHNSQHLSLDASPISQFDLLIQFLSLKRLPSVESPIKSKAGAMINLLGKSTSQNYFLKLPALPVGLEAYPKLYLKKECRKGRKMGHLNLIDTTGVQDLVKISEQILKEYEL